MLITINSIITTLPLRRACDATKSFTIGNPLLYNETQYYIRQTLTIEGKPLLYKENLTMDRNPFAIKDLPYCIRKPLTKEGKPLLHKELHYYKPCLTIAGTPLL